MPLPLDKLWSRSSLEVDFCCVILFFRPFGLYSVNSYTCFTGSHLFIKDEFLQNCITAELQSRERGAPKIRKKRDESYFFAVSWSQNTVLMLPNNWDDRVKQPRWPDQTTEMTKSNNWDDSKFSREFCESEVVLQHYKSSTFINRCLLTTYKNIRIFAKIRARYVFVGKNRFSQAEKCQFYQQLQDTHIGIKDEYSHFIATNGGYSKYFM